MTAESPRPGDTVELRDTAVPALDGTQATVAAVEDWGAHVETAGTATGRYRAAWDEMLVVARSKPTSPRSVAREQGFTGDICTRCQGSKMRQNGACLLCADCGETTGCS